MAPRAFSHFTLKPKGALNSAVQKNSTRHGVIIKYDGGYSSVFPWTEFGDEPLEEQINSIRNLRIKTNLVSAALHFAEIDAEARKQQVSLFNSLTIPKSHRLVTDVDSFIKNQNESFIHECIKIKLTCDPEKDFKNVTACAEYSKKIRLDANTLYTLDTFLIFWLSLSDAVKSKIEFIEDPIPYNEKDWALLAESHTIPLAYDFYSSDFIGEHYNVRIIKPMVQSYESIAEEEVKRGRKIVVTSSMDHALGVSAAAWVSGLLFKKYPNEVLTGGYSSFSAYQEDPFFNEITDRDGLFVPATGTGFGFDKLLKNLPWQEL
jgi:L-alanine-DL-glutamate epimerase-like enolase superfamily enzyme